ncbi:MAG: HEAT repeat domain-containing protein, partial [Anaerolineales bacterium]|nr:HEAT repeat domain-containing protein [Anaerolineales bacterium]
ALPLLIHALDDPSSGVRYLAATKLQQLGGQDTVNALSSYIQNTGTEAGKKEAAKILGQLVENQ